MDIFEPSAVIGTNSWGSAAYSVMVRGSYVDDDVIKSAMKTADLKYTASPGITASEKRRK